VKDIHPAEEPASSGGQSPRGSAPEGATLDVRPPEEEFRVLVQARMEALAKLRGAGAGPLTSGGGDDRLDLYAEALERGLTWIEEVRWR